MSVPEDLEDALRMVANVAADARNSPAFLDRMDQAHAALGRGLAADAWSTFVFDPSDPSRLMATHSLLRNRASRLGEYVANYRFLDPMARAFLTPRPVLLSEFVPDSAFGADAFTADFLAPDDIRYVLGVSSRLPDGMLLVSAFHRGATRRGDFTAADRLLAARASDHVGRAAFGAMLREKVVTLLAGEPSSEATATGAGMLIFDALGDLVHADPRARAVLRDLEALGALEGLSDDAVALAPLAPGAALERRRALSRSRSLHARLASFALTGGERGVLVNLVMEERDPVEARLLRAGLTPRERTIARLAAEGLGNDGIAFELGIASTTVAVHLTRIFRKTGVTGRVGLTRWLHGR
jgi:DNA-binding CsgD family transcriptional regulator